MKFSEERLNRFFYGNGESTDSEYVEKVFLDDNMQEVLTELLFEQWNGLTQKVQHPHKDLRPILEKLIRTINDNTIEGGYPSSESKELKERSNSF